MKKMKKLLAGLLAMTMAMSMTTMTALADETTINVASDVTIDITDTTKTGSLTIHKYEYNGETGTGTGSESDLQKGAGDAYDTLNGPVNADGNEDRIEIAVDKTDAYNYAIPLNGVTFKVTKVYELSDYYAIDGKTLPTVVAAQAKAESKSGDSESTDFSRIGNWMTGTTADGGTVKFDNLPLGIYLVEEIDAPEQITQTAAPFLVSIPMTNATGDAWLYDVHVYPKNKSTYGNVVLYKAGKVGTSDAAALQGATFILEVKTNGKWEQIKKNYKGVDIGVNGVLITGTNGTISVSDLAPGDYRFVETGVPNGSGYILDKVTTYEFTIAGVPGEDDDFEEGDVLIGDEVKEPDINYGGSHIQVTNYKPTVDKQIQRANGTWGEADTDGSITTYYDDADYSIGDTVPFRIVVDIPANIASLKTFTITDRMSAGLTYANADNFSVNIKGYASGDRIDDTSAGTSISGVTATIDQTDSQKWSVDFSSITDTLKSYTKIVIEFEAKLDTDAVIADIGNPNTVTLTYSNTISSDTSDPDSTTDLTDEVVVYTFKIDLTKTFTGAEDGTKYTAKFALYRKTTTGTTVLTLSDGHDVYVELVETKDAIYQKNDDVTYAKDDNGNELNGQITFNGLENGTYYLVETETANGYNLLKAPVEVKISREYVTTITRNANGNVTSYTTAFYATDDNGGATGNPLDDDINATQSITNNKGFTLPSTGGVGTYIFVFVGVSMMAAAVILFFTTKKKEAQKN